MTAGVGNTDIIVDGDLRVSGLVTFGQGDVTINDDGDIYNIGTLMAQLVLSPICLVPTSITLVFLRLVLHLHPKLPVTGQNTQLNQDKSVRIKLSNAGIASDYDFILPSKLGSVVSYLQFKLTEH